MAVAETLKPLPGANLKENAVHKKSPGTRDFLIYSFLEINYYFFFAAAFLGAAFFAAAFLGAAFFAAAFLGAAFFALAMFLEFNC
jgi:hypothetical protein